MSYFNYLDIDVSMEGWKYCELSRPIAENLFRATYYWWSFDKPPIKQRIAYERLVIVIAASQIFCSKNSMLTVAKKLGVTQPRLRNWLKLFRTKGIEGLEPKATL